MDLRIPLSYFIYRCSWKIWIFSKTTIFLYGIISIYCYYYILGKSIWFGFNWYMGWTIILYLIWAIISIPEIFVVRFFLKLFLHSKKQYLFNLFYLYSGALLSSFITATCIMLITTQDTQHFRWAFLLAFSTNLIFISWIGSKMKKEFLMDDNDPKNKGVSRQLDLDILIKESRIQKIASGILFLFAICYCLYIQNLRS